MPSIRGIMFMLLERVWTSPERSRPLKAHSSAAAKTTVAK